MAKLLKLAGLLMYYVLTIELDEGHGIELARIQNIPVQTKLNQN